MSSNNNEGDDEHMRDQTTTADVSDGDAVRDGAMPPDKGGSHRQRDSTARNSMSDPTLSRTEWEELKPNPDPRTDFGYRVDDWERFDTSDNSNQIIYLPSEESLLKEDAFIVAEEETLCDLGEFY